MVTDFKHSKLHPEGWNGTDRRKSSQPESTDPQIRELERYLDERLEEDRNQLQDMISEMEGNLTKLILSGYPNDDPTEHRKAHEAMIARATWWDKMRDEVLINVVKGGVGIALMFAAMAIWTRIKSEILK